MVLISKRLLDERKIDVTLELRKEIEVFRDVGYIDIYIDRDREKERGNFIIISQEIVAGNSLSIWPFTTSVKADGRRQRKKKAAGVLKRRRRDGI